MDDLTPKEARFVELFVLYNDVRRAAEEAGFSKTVASTKAYMWVSDSKTKPHVYEAVQTARKKLSQRTEITQERILQEYARIGFSDVRKAVKWRSEILTEQVDPDTGEAAGVYKNTVALVDSAELDDDTALAISEVKMDSRGGLSIKLHDKKAALDSMAKHLGMFDGKKGADDPELPPIEDSLRSAARDIAFALRRALNDVSPE